ncbi:MAG: ATP-binding cassette domain-containing protein [Bdellovibrionales bacterium]|jgi:ABC-2 type transport system ATP-binding protein|nr:ATP-binding cassette domain-containing protein [Bdellovibrionales bacterium]
MDMIEVSGLHKSYGPIQAVRDIQFRVKKGEVVGFLGPNGAGKSTTMKIITGSMAPSGGSVRVAGFDVFEDPIEVKKRIGYLPENPPVYGEMSIESYLRFVAKLKGVESGAVAAQVEKAIEKTDLGSVRKRLIQNLSKGYRQRVGIAQALVSDPEVLILDEPTSGLDPRQVAEVRALIKELRGEHTIILSTHILPEVQAMCERIIIINRGRIVAEDSLEGLSARMTGSASVQIRVARPGGALESALKGLEGVVSIAPLGIGQGIGHGYAVQLAGAQAASDAAVERIAEAAVASKAGLLELRREAVDLEEIFLKLTTNEENQVPGGVA